MSYKLEKPEDIPDGKHRALFDILRSIEQLKFYREAIFKPLPESAKETSEPIAE